MNRKDLPFEKYLKDGIEHLEDYELISLILRSGTKDCDVISVSEEILKLDAIINHGISGLFFLTEADILKIKGIGKVKASQIIAIIELAKRLYESRAMEDFSFDNPSKVASFYEARLRAMDRENVIVIFMDSKLRKISDDILSVGTVNSSILSPRDVFIKALKKEAVCFMIIHNHPSGDPSPSAEDINITIKLKNAGNMITIPIIDHIIIGDNRYYSMKEHGYI